MSERKVIAVIGSTGSQGGGLMRAILSDASGAFAAKGITRNVDSDKAKALTELGVEMVAADLDDEESLVAAFSGCHGAYCVTNFWEDLSPEKERQQARNLARAAKAARIRHAIWSTLEDTREWVPLSDDRMPTLLDHYKVPHFDAKGEANRFFADAGVPTTFLLTSFYWDNLIGFGSEPQRGEDGQLTFVLPMGDKKLPGIAAEDIGKCAYGIFKAGDKFLGRTVGIAGEHLTGAEMAAQLTESLGETVNHFAAPFDTYRSFDFPGAEDLGNMFQFKHDFNEDFRKTRDVDFARSLNPELMDFRGWLVKNGPAIPRH